MNIQLTKDLTFVQVKSFVDPDIHIEYTGVIAINL